MHARVLRFKGEAAKVDAGIDAYVTRTVPALREQEGYRGARLFVDRDRGTTIAISLWQDHRTMRATFPRTSAVRAETIATFGADAPLPGNYEVAVQQQPRPVESGNWVRVTTVDGDPDRIDAGIRHFESVVVPSAEDIRGFRGAVLFVDRASGNSLAVTAWGARKDIEESAPTISPVRTTAVTVMGALEPRVEVFEVVFAELSSEA